MHWFLDPIKNHYADFEGRATRKTFWMFILWYVILYVALSLALSLVGLEELAVLFSLAVLVPGLAITARRLHDTGLSGWWQLIGLIPLLGAIVLIVLCVRPSEAGANQYGATPHGDSDAVAPAAAAPDAAMPDTQDTRTPAASPTEDENTQQGYGQ